MLYFANARLYAQYLWERHCKDHCTVQEAQDKYIEELNLGESVPAEDTPFGSLKGLQFLGFRFESTVEESASSAIYVLNGKVYESRIGRHLTRVTYPNVDVSHLEKFVPEWDKKPITGMSCQPLVEAPVTQVAVRKYSERKGE